MGWFDTLARLGTSALTTISSLGSSLWSGVESVLTSGWDIISGIADDLGITDLFTDSPETVTSGNLSATDSILGNMETSGQTFASGNAWDIDNFVGEGPVDFSTNTYTGLDELTSLDNLTAVANDLTPNYMELPKLTTTDLKINYANPMLNPVSVQDRMLAGLAVGIPLGGLQYIMQNEQTKAADERAEEQRKSNEKIAEEKFQTEKDLQEAKAESDKELLEKKYKYENALIENKKIHQVLLLDRSNQSGNLIGNNSNNLA